MAANLLLINPKFPHNLASVIRAAACFGAEGVYWTGTRINVDTDRLPREERMKAYSHIKIQHVPYEDTYRPLQYLASEGADGTPVAVELLPNAISLPNFKHPGDVVYVFGPEDGSIPRGMKTACHSFIQIPSYHCLNLAAAVNVVMYDRVVKQYHNGAELPTVVEEGRGEWYVSALGDSR